VADDQMAGVQPAQVLAAAHLENPRSSIRFHLPALDPEVVGDFEHPDQFREEVAFFQLLEQERPRLGGQLREIGDQLHLIPVPISTSFPLSSTISLSAFFSVERRWAIASAVRPSSSRSIACWISASVSVSTAEVASSKIRIRGLFRIARAIEIRCFSPPESFTPRSPTSVSYPS